MTFLDLPVEAAPAEPAPRLTELQIIAKRVHERAADELADRERQRALLRRRQAEGATWDEMQAEAEISRPTLMRALRG
jgi:hypothetical protein